MHVKPNGRLITGGTLVGAALVLEIFKIYLAAQTAPITQLNIALFDTITFFLGGVGILVMGAVVSGWQSERDRAPFGRSAFQRAVELFQALRRFENGIDHLQESLRHLGPVAEIPEHEGRVSDWASEDGPPPRTSRSGSNIRPQALRMRTSAGSHLVRVNHDRAVATRSS